MTLSSAHIVAPGAQAPTVAGLSRPAGALRRGVVVAGLLAVALLLPAHASVAEDAPTRTVAPPARATDPLAGAAETIGLEESERAPSTLAESVEGSPGVQVRRSGGGAAPAFVSVRGAPPNQVRIILDGVPLHGGADDAFDISRLPPGLFSHLTVHRSTPPLRYGAPLPGGALVLHSPEASRSRAAGRVTGGGRLEREALGLLEVSDAEDRRTDLRLRLAGDRGDWRWYDDGGTPFDTSDDRPDARRQNNASQEAAWLLRHRRTIGGWRTTGLVLGSVLDAGVPGPAGLPTTRTSRRHAGVDAIAAIERRRWPREAVDLDGRAWVGGRVDGFDDPLGELGFLDQSIRSRTLRGGVAATGGWHPSAAVHMEIFADTGFEGHARQDELEPDRDLSVGRWTGGGGSELTLRTPDERVGLRGGARVDATHTGVRDAGGERSASPADSAHVSPLARVVALVFEQPLRVDAGVGIARASRVPSFHELFGDRGWAVGDADLVPETRTTVDGLLRLTARRGSAHALAEFGLFEAWTRDQIVWVQNAQGVRRPRNVGRVRLRGWEGRVALGHGLHRVELSGTILDAVQASGGDDVRGRQLPFVPDLSGHASAGTGVGRVRGSWTVNAASAFFVDEANSRALPARKTHRLDATVTLGRDRRWLLGATLRNLFDARVADAPFRSGGETVALSQPVTDALGFPLPGRTLLFTLGHEASLP